MRIDGATSADAGRHLRRGRDGRHRIRHREHNIGERRREERRTGAVTRSTIRENNYSLTQQEQFNGFDSTSPNAQQVMREQLDTIQGTLALLFTDDNEAEDMELTENIEPVQPGKHKGDQP